MDTIRLGDVVALASTPFGGQLYTVVEELLEPMSEHDRARMEMPEVGSPMRTVMRLATAGEVASGHQSERTVAPEALRRPFEGELRTTPEQPKWMPGQPWTVVPDVPGMARTGLATAGTLMPSVSLGETY